MYSFLKPYFIACLHFAYELVYVKTFADAIVFGKIILKISYQKHFTNEKKNYCSVDSESIILKVSRGTSRQGLVLEFS
jgi:hypothetical protein